MVLAKRISTIKYDKLRYTGMGDGNWLAAADSSFASMYAYDTDDAGGSASRCMNEALRLTRSWPL